MKNLDISLLKNLVSTDAQYDLNNENVFGSAYLVLDKNGVVFSECFVSFTADGKILFPKKLYIA